VTVLVTGATGFAGSHVVRKLVASGEDVAVIARPGSSRHRLDGVIDKIQILEGDLADSDAMRSLLASCRPVACIHLAWYAEPGKYLASPMNLNSLSASISLIEGLARVGCTHLVATGTCFEYKHQTTPLTEESPIGPTTLYAAAKLAFYLVAAQRAAQLAKAVGDMVQYRPSFSRTPDESNYGGFIAQFDVESRERTRAVFVPYADPPDAAAAVPTPDEWAQQVDHVIRLVGPEHVGIGLDMFGGRSGVPANAGGYPLLVDAIGRVTSRKNVELVTGENWLRVLEQVQGGRCDDGREHDRDERHREGIREQKAAPVAPHAHAAAGAPHGSCCC